MELNEKIYQEIEALCEEGDKLMERDQFDKAIETYNAALELLPSPKIEWEAGTLIYAALGDAYYFKGDYEKAAEFLYHAMNCPDGIINPFILLRLGECLFEIKAFGKAQEYLLRAYMLEGEELFEDEDGKYYEFVKRIIQ